MSEKETRNSLVIQAGILAAAGIIVRIIGLLYNTPLVKIIGDEGFGYYDSAYAAYSIVLLISSYSIPSAVSKIMAEHLAKGEYTNAFRIFKCTLLYVTVVGLGASAFVFFGAGILVNMESAVLPLKILAPTIFFSGLLGAFRGFFQAQKTMIPTSVSQIIEQIINAVFSVVMAYVLVNAASGENHSTIASFGAAGSTIGTGAGVISGLIFVVIIYVKKRPSVMMKVNSDTSTNIKSYSSILKMIFLVVTPFILSTGIYNLNAFLDKTLYQVILMEVKNVDETTVAFGLSAFAKANKLANVPIALSAAMASTLIPRLSGAVATHDYTGARTQVAKAVKITMFVSIPLTVLLLILSKPVITVLFNQPETITMASILLSVLALTVVFYGLSTMTQAVLQASGHLNIPIINSVIALIFHAGVMVLLLYLLPTGAAVYVYGGSTILYSVTLCVLNGIALNKYIGYRQEWKKTFIFPAIAALVMGVISFLSFYGIYFLTQSNLVGLLVAGVIGFSVYMVVCIKFRVISEEELKTLPKGGFLVRILHKIHLL